MFRSFKPGCDLSVNASAMRKSIESRLWAKVQTGEENHEDGRSRWSPAPAVGRQDHARPPRRSGCHLLFAGVTAASGPISTFSAIVKVVRWTP